MSETVETLTVYCRDNKRVCPLPKAWQQLWEMLPEKRRAVDAWEPAMPLIEAAWHDAPAMLKMVRLSEHIQNGESPRQRGARERDSQRLEGGPGLAEKERTALLVDVGHYWRRSACVVVVVGSALSG
jgi:hypothetical protein